MFPILYGTALPLHSDKNCEFSTAVYDFDNVELKR